MITACPVAGRARAADCDSRNLAQELLAAKSGNRQQLHTVLAGLWPTRLADRWLQARDVEAPPTQTFRQWWKNEHEEGTR